jgi:two-component system, OmpR family, sensor histidine kinase CreC
MSLSARIFFVYILFVSASSYFLFSTVMEEIKPGVRQSTEETLVDTANLLAEFLRQPMLENKVNNDFYADIFRAYGNRLPKANIWGVEKSSVNHRIYVTDRKGIVLLDSKNIAVGMDYSKWNDVYLTLQGQYGARSSPEISGDDSSTIMYVAAPIRHGDDIIGVVSVSKPNSSMQPYINRTQFRLSIFGGLLIAAGLIIGAIFSWWLSRELQKLRNYALSVSKGDRVEIQQSKIASGELQQLANALESMRTELEGKNYIENYVQTLTHELKSPLAGIRAAAEVLQSPMTEEQRKSFLNNIDIESQRLQQLIDRLLNLAKIEHQQSLHNPASVNMADLIKSVLQRYELRLKQKNIPLEVNCDPDLHIWGEIFLLEQAISNLLDNALDFTPDKGRIQIRLFKEDKSIIFSLFNQGEAIPDFALNKLTERFFSLPRPTTGKKSTGLGLNFVQEIMKLHRGKMEISNCDGGVLVRLIF